MFTLRLGVSRAVLLVTGTAGILTGTPWNQLQQKWHWTKVGMLTLAFQCICC